MPVALRIRDENTGNIIIDDQMLVGRYITSLTLKFNDLNQYIVTHDGFLKGTPFFQIYNPNSYYLNAFSPVFGNHSHVNIAFSGNQAICQQVFAGGVQSGWVDMQRDVIIYFGVY